MPVTTCSRVLTGHPPATAARSLTTAVQEPVLDNCWSFSLAWGGNKNAPVPLYQRPDTEEGGDRTEPKSTELFREVIFRLLL